jgi:hypothetical protein
MGVLLTGCEHPNNNEATIIEAIKREMLEFSRFVSETMFFWLFVIIYLFFLNDIVLSSEE